MCLKNFEIIRRNLKTGLTGCYALCS